MGRKEAAEKKEKPLDRMTAKELREMALKIEGIVGVHVMNKNELLNAIKEAKGIVDEKSGWRPLTFALSSRKSGSFALQRSL